MNIFEVVVVEEGVVVCWGGVWRLPFVRLCNLVDVEPLITRPCKKEQDDGGKQGSTAG